MKHVLSPPAGTTLLVSLHVVLLAGATVPGAESLVTNGNFQNWTGGAPDGWKVEVGAWNGAEQPKSEVSRIKGPALMLRGDATTMAWHAVSQEVPARPGGKYSLEFESRAKDVKREGRQHDNCYVGVMCFDSDGRPVARKSEDSVSADASDWKKHRLIFEVPSNAASTKVVIFLSKTGILGVTNVAVTEAGAAPAAGIEPAVAAEAKPNGLLVNGDFGRWTSGLPDGWTVEMGANNGGDQPKSEIRQLGDPGLALVGNAATLAWHSIGQQIPVRKGGRYTLEFQAFSENIQREGRQFDNCYAGVMCFDASGNVAGKALQDLSGVPRWKKHQIDFTVPANAESTKVLVFLSKTGTLNIKDVRVKEVSAARPSRGAQR